MAKGGFPGGGNMNNMIKQAQRLQKEIEKARAEIEAMEFTADAAGGKVSVVCNGKKEITRITVDPAVVDLDDLEMLEDILVVAVNDCLAKVDVESDKRLGQYNF